MSKKQCLTGSVHSPLITHSTNLLWHKFRSAGLASPFIFLLPRQSPSLVSHLVLFPRTKSSNSPQVIRTQHPKNANTQKIQHIKMRTLKNFHTPKSQKHQTDYVVIFAKRHRNSLAYSTQSTSARSHRYHSLAIATHFEIVWISNNL